MLILTYGVPVFRPLDVVLAAVYICEVCHKPFPSEADVRQHLRSCIDPQRQLRVQLERLTDEQVLSHKSPRLAESIQVRKSPLKSTLYRCSVCKVYFKHLDSLNLHMKIHIKPEPLFQCDSYAENFTPRTEQVTLINRTKRPRPKLKFSCDIPNCAFSSNLLKHLQLHKLRVHSKDTLACHLCGKLFKNYPNIRSHLWRHETATAGVIKCLAIGCHRTYNSASDLMKHMDIHKETISTNSPGPHECEHCGKQLQTEKLLSIHIKRHFLLLPGYLNCLYPKCKFVSVISSDLRKHVVRHEKTRPQFACRKCGECFPSGIRLKAHYRKLRSHMPTGNPLTAIKKRRAKLKNQGHTFACSYCGQNFATLNQYNVHIKRHVTVTPGVVQCAYNDCQQFFSSLVELQLHTKIHTTQNFACSVCGKCFNSNRSLLCHKQRHSEDRPFNCDVSDCSFSGKLRMDLTNHKRLVHNTVGFNCYMCGHFVKQLRSLKIHLEQHETGIPGLIKCLNAKCMHLSFSSSHDLKNHIEVVHKTLCGFRCHVAGCSFSCKLKTDLVSHKCNIHNIRRHVCPFCNKILKNSKQMKNHTKLHETVVPGVIKCYFQNCKHTTNTATNDLVSHLLSHKVDKKFCSISCDFQNCGKKFETLISLREHKCTEHSSMSWTCATCGILFPSEAQLSLHAKSHVANGTTSQITSRVSDAHDIALLDPLA